jgi:hypothetical protein
MNPPAGTASYDWHSGRRGVLWLACIGCFTLAIVCLLGINEADATGKIFIYLFALSFGICGIAFLIPGKTTVDISNRLVSRRLLLFGRLVLFQRNSAFSDFRSVLIRCTPDHDGDTYFVGLRRLSGRKLWIRYWNVPHGQVCNAASELAASLAKDIDLPIERPESHRELSF